MYSPKTPTAFCHYRFLKNWCGYSKITQISGKRMYSPKTATAFCQYMFKMEISKFEKWKRKHFPNLCLKHWSTGPGSFPAALAHPRPLPPRSTRFLHPTLTRRARIELGVHRPPSSSHNFISQRLHTVTQWLWSCIVPQNVCQSQGLIENPIFAVWNYSTLCGIM